MHFSLNTPLRTILLKGNFSINTCQQNIWHIISLIVRPRLGSIVGENGAPRGDCNLINFQLFAKFCELFAAPVRRAFGLENSFRLSVECRNVCPSYQCGMKGRPDVRLRYYRDPFAFTNIFLPFRHARLRLFLINYLLCASLFGDGHGSENKLYTGEQSFASPSRRTE